MDIATYEQIENYLGGHMQPREVEAFEQRIRLEPDLAKEVAAQKALLSSFEVYGKRKSLKLQLESIHEEMKVQQEKTKIIPLSNYGIRVFWKKHLTTMAVAASVAVITVISTLMTIDYVQSLESRQITYYRALKRDLDNIKKTQNKITGPVVSSPATATPERQVRYSATGFVISANGYLVTNYHVVEGADSLYIESKLDKSIRYKVKSVYSNPAMDLAVLQIVDSSFKSFGRLPYTFKSRESDLGEMVYTLGFPREDMVYGDGTISSRSGFEGDTTAYQISIPVNPGNSGGPLMDDKGHLVGIITGKNYAEDGAAFAIKSSYLIKLLNEIPKDSLTVPLSLPKTNYVKNLKRPEQIKKLQDLVFSVKVYH